MSDPTIAPRAGDGPSLWVLGSLYTFKVRGSETAGAYAIVEAKAWPGQGPPPHVHHAEDECFHVLEGTFSFLHHGRTFEGGPGTFLRVAKGDLHTFRCVGDAPGRVLLIVAPAGLDDFWEAVGLPVVDPTSPPPPTPELMARVLELAPRHHLELRP